MSNGYAGDTNLNQVLKKASAVYPQPIALACARVLRSRTSTERLDSILRCGEVLTRYLALSGIASVCAREDGEAPESMSLSAIDGPLSWGHFLSALQETAKVTPNHPLKPLLAKAFLVGAGKEDNTSTVDASLSQLLTLRNGLGHDLVQIDAPRAKSILETDRPEDALGVALVGLDSVLSLPLFVFEAQWLSKRVPTARRLLLMGAASDVEPQEVRLSEALMEDMRPYLAVGKSAICLDPLIHWGIAQSTQNYRLFFLDGVEDRKARYRSAATSERLECTDIGPMQAMLRGEQREAEPVTLESGGSLTKEWRATRREIENNLEQRDGQIPWEVFDEGTLRWFTERLSDKDARDGPSDLISEKLFDGRDLISPRERDQAVLLFGTETAVRQVLRRDLIDLRLRKTAEARWDERETYAANILSCLRFAVEFFARHLNIAESGLDGLTETSGTADYVAMREALVNLFIHQDFQDDSAAAQVEITRDKAEFFNPGRSLVSSDKLVDGGKSQSRNPLIGRALRLIGFAELAGSGLRELHRVWRIAHRRPPIMESNKASNTYTLTIDWRQIPNVYDKYWKDKIGVHLNEQDARILNLAFDEQGVSPAEAASATGMGLSEANETLRRLEVQVLVEKRRDRYFVTSHIKEIADE